MKHIKKWGNGKPEEEYRYHLQKVLFGTIKRNIEAFIGQIKRYEKLSLDLYNYLKKENNVLVLDEELNLIE